MKGEISLFVVDINYVDDADNCDNYHASLEYVWADTAQKAADEVRSWYDYVEVRNVFKAIKGWK